MLPPGSTYDTEGDASKVAMSLVYSIWGKISNFVCATSEVLGERGRREGKKGGGDKVRNEGDKGEREIKGGMLVNDRRKGKKIEDFREEGYCR